MASMSQGEEIFKQLTDGVFSPSELNAIEASAVTRRSRFVPLELDAADMVGAFDEYLEALDRQSIKGPARRQSLQRLAKGLLRLSGIVPGEEIAVCGPRSVWLLGGERLRGWGALDGSQQIRAGATRLLAATWYELPVDRRLVADDFPQYGRGEGLWIRLQAARLVEPDGQVQLLGEAAVPLHHGEPELYRVAEPTDN